MVIGATYYEDMAIAVPGQVSDTSAYNIDGACVIDETADSDILVGAAVQIKEIYEGHKVVKSMSGGGIPYGVAIRSHYQTQSKNGKMVYEAGSAVNVITHGRVWVVSGDSAAQAFNSQVKLDETGQAKSDGTVATGWTYTGDFTKFGDINLAEIQILQNAPIPTAAP